MGFHVAAIMAQLTVDKASLRRGQPLLTRPALLIVACPSRRGAPSLPNQAGHSLRVTCSVTASMDSGAYQFAARDGSPTICTSTSKPPHRLARIMVP